MTQTSNKDTCTVYNEANNYVKFMKFYNIHVTE